MKLTPLLDMWQKPDGAGDPVAVLATSFTLDPDFFERNCLARFLALESANEESGSAEDLVARLELEEGLRAPMVTVLVDRSAHAERSSLRWDLLHCHVSNGLLHSKVAILLWERATRVIVGSANLTPAGYRHNIELAMAVDLGSSCLFPREVLDSIADELQAYLDLVPGLDPNVPARRQAARTLQHFRRRIAALESRRTPLKVWLAPSNVDERPLGLLPKVWSGPQPLEATQVSPYWDASDPVALESVRKLLTGRPATDRKHRVAVTIGPSGDIAFPLQHRELVRRIVQLGPLDDNVRPLHAKALIVQSTQWIAALIGSSNHTAAGLGLGGQSARRHRELNVWIGAPLDSKEGRALHDLVPCGKTLGMETGYEEPEDEDEPEQVSTLPAFFQLCRLSKAGEDWQLQLTFNGSIPPREWRVGLPNGTPLIDSATWQASGGGATFTLIVDTHQLPMFLDVAWDGNRATWAIIADDRHDLPPGLGLADLQSAQLLEALVTGKTLAQILREKLQREAERRSQVAQGGIITDPLKRFDSRSSLLRRGRALATALAALESRLARPVTTLDALEARLSGPLGPVFIANRLVTEFNNGGQPRADTLFTLAEIALSVARVPWDQTLQHVDRGEAASKVRNVLSVLSDLRFQIGDEPSDLASYAARAIMEARTCI